MKLKRTLLYTLITSMAIVGVGCTPDVAPQTTTEVSQDAEEELIVVNIAEVTHSVFYAPQYVAIENGYFEEEGLEVTLLGAQGADKTMASLLSGEVQVGLMGPEASIYVYTQGSPDYAINFAQLTKRDGSFLLSRVEEPDFKFSDLSGADILGGRKGGVPFMTLEYVVQHNGVKIGEDVASGEANVRSDIAFDVMAGAFIGGEGDYVTLFEPLATQVEQSGAGYIVASIGAESGEIPYTAYSALDSYIEDNPKVIQSFTNAIYKGQQFVAENDASTIAEVISPQFTELSIEDLTTVVQRYKDIDAWNSDPFMTEQSLDMLMNVMEIAGELDVRAPFDAIVDNQFAINAMLDDL
ncbi:MAG: nitrate ABC transporter substrate-binding protein [Epulopiscium sp. Nuni2H_MBin003]|nr:MAG: nitrate ABC transporter substrate-binding protein [Epulopiscium sp. Nuni2H_MBin003]